MFHYFGILRPSDADEEILAPGIETPPNIVRQKRFFGGSRRTETVLRAPPEPDAEDEQRPLRFVTFFMPPYA